MKSWRQETVMEAIFLCLIFLVLRVSGNPEGMFAFPLRLTFFSDMGSLFFVQLFILCAVDCCRLRFRIEQL